MPMQLHMHLDTLENLPPLTPPEGLELRPMAAGEEREWVRIIADSFRDPRYTFDGMQNDPCYAPERVWFALEGGNPVATASAWRLADAPDWGVIHMVGALRGAGAGAGYWVVLAALHALRAEGFRRAKLTTDDFRLPAIATYQRLGFQRVLEVDVDMPERWARIDENLAQYKARNREPLDLGAGVLLEGHFLAGEGNGCVIVCPGGGYAGLAPHEAGPVAALLNREGLSAAVLRYRVAPHRHPLPLQDLQAALRAVRKRAGALGIDPHKVAVLGFSAGGHLCAMAGVHHTGPEDRPDAMVLCYPVISFGPEAHVGSIGNLLGRRELTEDEVRYFSPHCCATPETPPAFIWHTADDEGVPVANSLLMAGALAKQGVPVSLHVFPHGRHGLGLAPRDSALGQWIPLMLDWFRGLGFLK